MEPTIPAQENTVSNAIQETAEIIDQVSAYGSLITNSLLLIIAGMIVVFLLHTLASKFLYPHLKNRRFIKVVFGTMYVLIIVVALLLTLNKLGFDTSSISKIAILGVLAGAVIIFFLVPFLPRLPFIPGQMIEVNGVTGIVANISTVHTTIRTFDGTMVFIPNPLVLASKIINYHDEPERRLALNLAVSHDTDIKEVQALLHRLMTENDLVLDEPTLPIVMVTEADANGTRLTAFCWVKNGDWLAVRSDLWTNVVDAFNKNDRITMSRPQQEIYVIDEKKA